MTKEILQVTNLKTQFFTQDGTVTAVDDVSFEVVPGEMVGIVGESGCGKSTAALSIMQLLPPQGQITSGQIVLDGQDIATLSGRQVRALRGPKMAMVFQDSLAALNPTLKVGKQLMEPLQIHMRMSAQEARQEAIRLLNRVGIPEPETRMDVYAHELSGGMRQRVMIAMALSCNPKLLIADEPTTALDVTVQSQILDLMLELRNETESGLMLITHDVGVVAETCDRVVVMYAGRVVETGPTEEVFERPRHYYTIGLLHSSVDLERDRNTPLDAIKGMPPDLIELPPGCYFWPRCPYHIEICQQKTPELEEVGEKHRSACWRADTTDRWHIGTKR
jgi:oligopeptide/dipeptide ABC transporter ATP-binding protein